MYVGICACTMYAYYASEYTILYIYRRIRVPLCMCILCLYVRTSVSLSGCLSLPLHLSVCLCLCRCLCVSLFHGYRRTFSSEQLFTQKTSQGLSQSMSTFRGLRTCFFHSTLTSGSPDTQTGGRAGLRFRPLETSIKYSILTQHAA